MKKIFTLGVLRTFCFLIFIFSGIKSEGQVNASFTYTFVNNSQCVPAIVNFNSTSTGLPPLTYNWTFQNGSPSSSVLDNPTVLFSTCGDDTIILVVTNGVGATSTLFVVITVACNPTANFVLSPSSGCEPLTVHFNDLSIANSGFMLTQLWDFCDGSTSTAAVAVHDYLIPGCYCASLLVTNIYGCSDDTTIQNAVCVSAPPSFQITSSTPSTCLSNLCVNYQCSNVTGGVPPYNFNWSFSGASPASSNMQNPNNICYSIAGTYSVSLIVIDGNGCSSTITLPNYVNIAGSAVTACFTSTPSTVCSSTAVQFTNCSTPYPYPFGTTFHWDFGDGTYSTLESPSHFYNDTGCFDVTLIANVFGCSDTVIHNYAVCVAGPIAYFTSYTNCDSPNVVIFDGTNSIAADNYQWSFPGGNPSTSTAPVVHVTYSTLNTNHTAQLVVCNNFSGCCDTASTTFFLSDMNPNVTVDTVVCFGEASAVSDTLAGVSGTLWKIFDMCNGGALVQTSSYHCFSAACPGFIQWTHPGLYHVVLKINYMNGCIDTLEWNVHVNGLEPGFISTPVSGCDPVLVTFTDTTLSNCVSNPVSYHWNFGDADSSLLMNPQHTYTSTGNYSVTEIVTDQHGCVDSLVIPSLITIGIQLTESHINPANGNANGSINLSVSGGTLPYNYQWSNGATTQDINNISAGNYSVTVTDANSCSSTLTITLLNSCLLSFNVSSTTPTTCANNLCVDFFCSNPTGGTAPYNFSWNFIGATPNNSSQQNPSNICYTAGSYSVSLTVSDAGGCSVDTILQNYINVGTGLTATENHTDEYCSGANAMIDLSVNGIAPYTYVWSNGATTQDLSNLSAGNYSVTITDADGCVFSLNNIATINHAAPTITMNHVDASCLTCHNGSATVLITGGTAPYTIQWNTGSTGNPIINIDPGEYHVCVTDANGCSVCDSVVVNYETGIVSLEENNSAEIIPNPNAGIFTLTFSHATTIEQIEIVNVLGEKIYSAILRQAQNDSAMQFDFSDTPNGIYFLEVKTMSGVMRKKIVIRR